MRVYLDHSATTPVDPRVVEAMLPFLTDKFGNASSVHSFGQEARAAVDRARREVAALIGARANEIIFLSGGTEANNLAIRGVCDLRRSKGHIITSSIEHPSVDGLCKALAASGWQVSNLPVYHDGVVRVEDVREALRPETVLVSVMLANNEIGTVQPIAEIAELLRSGGNRDNSKPAFHVDAVQAAGRIPIDVDRLGCDLLSLSGHKLYAPKGIGALFIRRGTRLTPQAVGGHQERERRAGTESVPLIVALGTAARLATEELAQRSAHTKQLRDYFERRLRELVTNVIGNGDPAQRLPHLSNFSFRYIEGESLLISLDLQGIAVSTGAACSSGTLEPSPVIRALGRNDEEARGSIRFSFGKDNTSDEVDYVLQVLPQVVTRLRSLSPLNKPQSLEPVAAE